MTNTDSTTGLLRDGLPPPPIPSVLREELKDYPEYLERLQQVLNKVAEEPPSIISSFERAIWALQNRLDTLFSEAMQELRAAEASGDAEAIAVAKAKSFAIGAASTNMYLPDLREHFKSREQS